MACEQALRVHAYCDGELDADGILAVERHLAECADCAALRDEIEGLRTRLKSAPYHRAPPDLRRRIDAALVAEAGERVVRPARGFWAGAMGGAGITALAASLALFALLPPAGDALTEDVVAAHQRSLMGDHLIDVVSTDHHTVKPWFAGHADVSPPAVDYAGDGFRLVGGRVDFVHGMRAAVVVYRHDAHVIAMFAWADRGGAVPAAATRDGYHEIFWKDGNLVLCAVSDVSPEELDKFVALIKKAAMRE